MTGNEIRPFLKSRIRIPIRHCSLTIHSPGICMLRPIKLSTVIMLGDGHRLGHKLGHLAPTATIGILL